MRAGRIEYDGKPALLLHVRDITERRAAATAVQSSEMLFRSVWENSVDGMRLTDENGVIIAVNNAYCKLFGLEAEELEGKPFTIVYAESENPEQCCESIGNISAPALSDRKINARSHAAQRPGDGIGNHRFVHRIARASAAAVQPVS